MTILLLNTRKLEDGDIVNVDMNGVFVRLLALARCRLRPHDAAARSTPPSACPSPARRPPAAACPMAGDAAPPPSRRPMATAPQAGAGRELRLAAGAGSGQRGGEQGRRRAGGWRGRGGGAQVAREGRAACWWGRRRRETLAGAGALAAMDRPGRSRGGV
uniref:Uncharacterized protein n=1 Tax=Setaria viridis TaxID=4556 RepID=A0A4U6SWR4_SETVI|nr:hypothetical protein SEVIR_9G196400v2 [Setaria viridis]